MYFYSWGNARVPIVLQPVGGLATKAAAFVERLGQWLADARISSCRKGAQAGLPENLWQCEFERDGEKFRICWTHEGAARLPTPSPGERLDGDRVETGVITGIPMLLRSASR